MGEPTGDVDILRRIEDTTLNDQELARYAGVLEDWKTSESAIRTFFAGRCVLVTGGTGFMGKILVEKLLRTCHEIRAVFLLMRGKKGDSPKQRLDAVFENPMFDILNKEQPNFRKKVIPFVGDTAQLNAGLSPEDRATIQAEVSVIFNVAAIVKFDETLKLTTRVNVRGTSEMLKLARGCPKLVSFVHFSTAFSNCTREYIEEKFYDPPMDPTELIELVENRTDEELALIAPKIMGAYPNTYVFSKAVAEKLVETQGRGLPISVFRPSIVIGTYREPVRGWSDNVLGPAGVVIGAGLGVFRAILCDENKVADMVPVDMAVNSAITVAWRTAKDGVTSEPPRVYNYVSSPQKPITWGKWCKYNCDFGLLVPSMHAVWFYSLTFTTNPYLHKFYDIFLHYLPALLFDAMSVVMRQPPRMLKICEKINKFNTVITFFTLKQWKWNNDNVLSLWSTMNPVDQQLFNFNIDELDWLRHTETNIMGLRVYVLKDPASTMPEARVKWQRLKMLHMCTKGLFVLFVLYIMWCILSIFL